MVKPVGDARYPSRMEHRPERSGERLVNSSVHLLMAPVPRDTLLVRLG
jgi:hypothetical protein